METADLLESLGYSKSRNCVRGEDLAHAPEFGHVFRRAQESSSLQAVYCLRPPPGEQIARSIPVSYVCKATSFDQADEIHRLVWNQNVVPFLIVLAPQGVRVYTGFERKSSNSRQCLIESSISDVASK